MHMPPHLNSSKMAMQLAYLLCLISDATVGSADFLQSSKGACNLPSLIRLNAYTGLFKSWQIAQPLYEQCHKVVPVILL